MKPNPKHLYVAFSEDGYWIDWSTNLAELKDAVSDAYTKDKFRIDRFEFRRTEYTKKKRR